MNSFLVLYQKSKFESGNTIAPPTLLRIVQIFVGLVMEETATVPSDKDTQASLDTIVTQVWHLSNDTPPVRLW